MFQANGPGINSSLGEPTSDVPQTQHFKFSTAWLVARAGGPSVGSTARWDVRFGMAVWFVMDSGLYSIVYPVAVCRMAEVIVIALPLICLDAVALLGVPVASVHVLAPPPPHSLLCRRPWRCVAGRWPVDRRCPFAVTQQTQKRNSDS